ncbi:MAG TPA: phosphomannomutase [Candidatus Ozemobacteraceae bacterium]|nr:phosphomannomutase [Candidatus Ozemobacteraceae bacterium]
MGETIRIADLMDRSGVGFGTSGARGLVSAMNDRVCYAYTLGFLRYLEARGEIVRGARFALAGDLRASTPGILRACSMAARDAGFHPVNAGAIPTPALTAWAIDAGIPSAMVTGSHIPDDRNGIKFNRPAGEILKDDEAGIRRQLVELPDIFDSAGSLRESGELPPNDGAARAFYLERYLRFFPAGSLTGMRIGVYEHSSVARDLLVDLLERLGAEVVRLARSETFIPVDTEAVRPEDIAYAREWAADGRLFALCSTDGDGDRPLVGNERGEWIRGDVAGILAAKWLGADTVVTPVSSNTAVEKCGWFDRVIRTRIGSPYVIAAMQAAADRARVVGYEANGGFLIQSPIERDDRTLAPLPTRDAVIVILALLRLARERALPLSGLSALLPARYTASDRLKEFPTAMAKARIDELASGSESARSFFAEFGSPVSIDETDGLRMTFGTDEIIHLRPSGNAPELRCYVEATTPDRAESLNRRCLEILAGWR